MEANLGRISINPSCLRRGARSSALHRKVIFLGSESFTADVTARLGAYCRFAFRNVRGLALLFLAFIAVTGGPNRACAQTIAVDPASAVEAASSSITMNHTVGTGANRYLIVSVAIERSDATVATVTYAGQPLTFLGRLTDTGAGATLDLWARLAPTSGTNQVVVTLSRGAAVVVGAKSFSNVSQSNPLTGTIFSGNGTIASGSVTSSANQLVLATLAANDEVNTATASAGQTSRYNVLNAADVIGAASTKPASAGSTNMSYSLASSGRWVLAVIALEPANPFVVVTTNDSGAGSLREAINAANVSGAADTITFNIPGAGPHTITLSSALPVLSGNGDTIDGSTQPGAQCHDLWAGAPHDLRISLRGNGSIDGLLLAGSNQTVRGLALTAFRQAINLRPSSNTAALYCNYIGLLPNGLSSANLQGVVVSGTSARIGGLGTGQGNVISGNTEYGILTTQGSTDTSIRNNFIGTDPMGGAARSNGTAVNHFNGAGSWRDITYNLISGNNAGIVLNSDDFVTPSTDTIRIQRNRIGFNRTLTELLLNSGDGIYFDSNSTTNVLIGGNAATEGNEISGGNDAIDLRAVSDIRIRGNTIARAAARGIWLAGSSNITVGGTAAGEGNTIGGNGSDGMFVGGNASEITILGNLIQPITIAGATTANADHGIWIERAANVNIGDGTAAGRNIISGNRRRGIQGSTINSNIAINGNFIGTDATGNVAVVGGQNFDLYRQDAIAFDDPAGSVTNLAIVNNVIGGYSGALIEAWNTTINGLTIQGNNIGVGANGTAQITFGNIEELVSLGGSGAYSNVLIGGTAAGQENIVAFGSRSGIRMDSTGSNLQIIGNTIRNNDLNGIIVLGNTSAAIISNRIYANGLIGIDLGDNGVTQNDPGDGDAGANNLLNFPVINSFLADGTTQAIYDFNLDAPANANGYRIEFFRSSAADPSGNGEGEEFIGAVDISHTGGNLDFSGLFSANTVISADDLISATATRKTGSGYDITSEFAEIAVAKRRGSLTVAISSEVYDPGAAGLFAIPLNDQLTIATITNEVGARTTNDSIFLIIDVPADTEFYNGDIDGSGPGSNPIAFIGSNAPGISFNYFTDVRYSDAATRPDYAGCTYTPAAGYDPNVRFICINPKGSMPQGDPPPSFAVQFRQRIR